MKIILCFFIFFTLSYAQINSKDTVKAKIAVLHKFGNEYNALKSKDRVKAGEMVRIFVQPVNESFIYVIYSDNEESTLLFNKKISGKSEPVILPDENDFYVFDDKSSTAKITILCSADPLKKLEEIFKNSENINYSEWSAVESGLTSNEKKNLGDKTDKPFPIAGKVSNSVNKDFLNNLQVFTGNNILIRKYEIEIKK